MLNSNRWHQTFGVPTKPCISITGNDAIAPVPPRFWCQTKKGESSPKSAQMIGNGDDRIASQQHLVFTHYHKATWKFWINVVTQAKLTSCFGLKCGEAKNRVFFVPDDKLYRASAEATHTIKQDDRGRGDAHCW